MELPDLSKPPPAIVCQENYRRVMHVYQPSSYRGPPWGPFRPQNSNQNPPMYRMPPPQEHHYGQPQSVVPLQRDVIDHGAQGVQGSSTRSLMYGMPPQEHHYGQPQSVVPLQRDVIDHGAQVVQGSSTRSLMYGMPPQEHHYGRPQSLVPLQRDVIDHGPHGVQGSSTRSLMYGMPQEHHYGQPQSVVPLQREVIDHCARMPPRDLQGTLLPTSSAKRPCSRSTAEEHVAPPSATVLGEEEPRLRTRPRTRSQPVATVVQDQVEPSTSSGAGRGGRQTRMNLRSKVDKHESSSDSDLDFQSKSKQQTGKKRSEAEDKTTNQLEKIFNDKPAPKAGRLSLKRGAPEVEDSDLDDPKEPKTKARKQLTRKAQKKEEDSEEEGPRPREKVATFSNAAEADEVIVINSDSASDSMSQNEGQEAGGSRPEPTDEDYWTYYEPMLSPEPVPDKSDFDCVVCQANWGEDTIYRGTLKPCNHGSYCFPCAISLLVNDGICALCRAPIQEVKSELVPIV